MSGQTRGSSLLTLISADAHGNRTQHNYYGPVPVSKPPGTPAGSPEWIRKIWASGDANQDIAFNAALGAANQVMGADARSLLGSSYAGLSAQLFVVGENQPISIAATLMSTYPAVELPDPTNPGVKVPLVSTVIAWTHTNLMTAVEQQEFHAAMQRMSPAI